MRFLWPRVSKKDNEVKRLWLDLGDLGDLVNPSGPHEQWQDHGLGLLRTLMHQNGLMTDIASTRAVTSWNQLKRQLQGYDMVLMNVRSYTYPVARKAAELFKEVNPKGLVLAGGMHATVALDEMLEVAAFDKICQGPGENIILDLVRNPEAFPRVVLGQGSKSMAEWPMIDRTLWPKPASRHLAKKFNWPLEPECGWGPPPVATIITSRVCPWQCVFCNENSYIPNMGRRPVEMVIEELNYLDNKYGVGSIVIHDSMFFQNPSWLEEWIEKYPRKANKIWPYWAAARSDTVRQWPELFTALIKETNWNIVSIGFESGSDRILRLLNKECTEEDNYFAINLLDQIGDEMEAQGREAPKFWANIMLGVPGETSEDAFKTMRMLKYMKRVYPSISYYAPYPGSALGYQLIAEGKSMMSKENYHRFPGDEKVKGVDYAFYRELLAGKFDQQINQGLSPYAQRRSGVFTEALIKA
ncbi:MAG: B12-binding domain-containing radical SAM protein [Chloroflexi bacterium]|nr:B12-binding domain-containing radical SAM protein [Chloroflexota bacterium]MBP8055591.1 B12-binding domain-containing radical SAM protein [Chloroflexota bacterium]